MSGEVVIGEEAASALSRPEMFSYKLEKFTKRKSTQVRSTIHCDQSPTKSGKASREAVIAARRQIPQMFLPAAFLWLLVATTASLSLTKADSLVGLQSESAFQVVGQANEQVHLPCLIGRQLYCGEPYFIAWYKLNSSSKSWTRIDHKTLGYEESAASNTLDENSFAFNESVRFTWSRANNQQQQHPTSCNQLLAATNSKLALRTTSGSSNLLRGSDNFECSHLTISQVELLDEGQYKCEITFSEALDFDKCPPTTLSQLNVIARPNEPELLVNGQRVRPTQRQLSETPTRRRTLGQLAPGSFKEAAQVRLECQSSGGKPAPRIEWLNVSLPGGQQADEEFSLQLEAGRAEIQLMRLHWPQKKTFAGGEAGALGSSATAPLSSSSVSFSLSRFDLNSRFLCLVLPAQPGGSQQQQQAYSDQLITSSAYLSQVLAINQQRSAASGNGKLIAAQPVMLKWIRLDVQVKPSRVSLVVKEAESGAQVSAQAAQGEQPLYSLAPQRLYALQCQVEHSRPPTRLTWFNRTAPITLEQQELGPESGALDFVLPESGEQRRLASFSRSLKQADGTFSTTATLLLATNFWDNLEELFCRASNEAFEFDELIQVAPIKSARLYVNYPPSAWLELASGGWRSRVTLNAGGQLALRCTVAANPLNQNAILQIEWLKDGRKLAPTTSSSSSGKAAAAANLESRVEIEKANHLHMPWAGAHQSQLEFISGAQQQTTQAQSRPQKTPSAVAANQLAPGSKLISSSVLTISALNALDAGNYACLFKLIPAPGPTQTVSAPQSGAARITSGAANATIQVEVIEARPSAPLIRVQSTRAALVYELQASASRRHSSKRLITLLVEQSATLSFRCELGQPMNSQLTQRATSQLAAGHKVMWFLDGAFLHSSANSDAYNLTLDSLEPVRKFGALGGSLSCAHHILASASPNANRKDEPSQHFHGSLMRVYQSLNEFDLRVKVWPPKLLQRRDLLPAVRSFSELELNAAPANKLKLACAAQCEPPICSIEWLFNKRKLTPLAGQDAPWIQAQDATNTTLALTRRRMFQLEAEGSNEEQPQARFFSTESLLHQRNQSVGAGFSWFSGASLSWRLQSEQAPDALEMASETRQLLNQVGGANLISRLELTYNQIGQLLARAQSESLELACRLSVALDGFERPHLHLLQLEPLSWFPETSDSSADWWPTKSAQLVRPSLSSDELQISVLLDKPPSGLSILFAGRLVSASAQSGDSSGLSLSESQLLELSTESHQSALACNLIGKAFPAPRFQWTFTDLNKISYVAAEGAELNLRHFLEIRSRQLNVKPFNAHNLELVGALLGNYTCTASNIHGTKSVSLPLKIQGRPLCKLSLGAQFLGPENELLATLVCSVYSAPPLLETSWFRNNQQFALNKSQLPDESAAAALDWSSQQALSSVEQPVIVLNKQQEFLLADLLGELANFKCVAKNALGFSQACELNQLDKQTLLKTMKPLQSGQLDANGKSTAARFPSLMAAGRADLSSGLAARQPLLNYLANSSGNIEQLGSSQHLEQANNFALNATGGGSAAPKGVTFWGSALNRLFSRLDLILGAACSLTLAWLLFVVGSSVLRRRFGHQLKLRGPKSNTSWRFNPVSGAVARASSNNEMMVGAPFQSKMSSANYYGGSNGDSERDMMQSCSQSSHYEDFVLHQQRQLAMSQQIQLHHQQQHQPLYFNSAQHHNTRSFISSSTLNRAPSNLLPTNLAPCNGANSATVRQPAMKASLSGSSTGESGSGSGKVGGASQSSGCGSGTMRDLSSSIYHSSSGVGGLKLAGASTVRDSFGSRGANATHDSQYLNGLTLTSNVPLISGNTLTSRIHLEHNKTQPKSATRKQQYQFQTHGDSNNNMQNALGSYKGGLGASGSRNNEHIYDDVIYNQIIL